MLLHELPPAKISASCRSIKSKRKAQSCLAKQIYDLSLLTSFCLSVTFLIVDKDGKLESRRLSRSRVELVTSFSVDALSSSTRLERCLMA